MNIDIEAIRARAEAATPGPWYEEWITGDPECPEPYTFGTIKSAEDGKEICDCKESNSPNSHFIAHAREDIPALIAEVERLREIQGKQGERLEEYRGLKYEQIDVITDIKQQLATVMAERDAAVEEIPRTAHNCAHAKNCERARIDNRKCPKCHAWEWQGERSGENG